MNCVPGGRTQLRRKPRVCRLDLVTAVCAIGWGLSAGAVPLIVPASGVPATANAPGAPMPMPLLSTPATLASASAGETTATGTAPAAVRARGMSWQLPLAFEPATEAVPAGSSGADAGYTARGPGYSVHVRAGGAYLALSRAVTTADADGGTGSGSGGSTATVDRGRLGDGSALGGRSARTLRVVGVRFEGASDGGTPRVEDPLPGRIHRLQGGRTGAWRTGLQAFGRVVYPGVYDGIDVAYYGRGRELEYDFVVAPGADPGQARLRFEGVRRSWVDARGDLMLETGGGVLVQRRPEAYQQGPEGRETVEAAYEVAGDGTVGFRLGGYDSERPLVIDPVLSYATFVGGSGLDQCWDIAVDSGGHAYVVGETESVQWSGLRMISTNAFQGEYQGGLAEVAGDAFVAKLAPDGSAFEWFTFLGGSDLDGAYAVAVGAGDEPVVVGFTTSTNFPVTEGAYRSVVGGPTNRFTGRAPMDAFVTRLRADGSGLVASTLFGGDQEDQGLDVVLLPDQSVAIVGSTTSTNLPVTAGVPGGLRDGFVAVLTADGTGLRQARYLGGSGRDSLEGVALSPGGDLLHVVGITESTNLPVVGSLQSTNAGSFDLLLAGVRVADGEAEYTTYLGGTGDDYGYRVGVGGSGAVWAAGVTFSADFPVASAWVSTNSGFGDGVVVRLSPDGGALELSTYFGGASNDSFWDVAVDPLGQVHLTGETLSTVTNLPGVSADTILSTNLGLSEILLVRVGTNGVPSTTIIGAAGDELGYAVAADAAGNAYVAGRVRSIAFPVTGTNVAQAVYGGDRTDGFALAVAYEPALTAEADGDGIRLSWPAPNAGFVLESAPVGAGDGGAGWVSEPAAVLTEGGRHVVRLPMAVTNGVFRLRWAR